MSYTFYILVYFLHFISCAVLVLIYSVSNCFYFFIFLLSLCFFVFFFFSSRRRHTRCLSDWSSDVCSSDLVAVVAGRSLRRSAPQDGGFDLGRGQCRDSHPAARLAAARAAWGSQLEAQIGRASCRERVGGAEGEETGRKTEAGEG